MTPLSVSEIPVENIRAVFSDLDDTLTENGRILPSTFETIWNLKKAGYWLVVVSGRPAGWADALMRLWPIDHMIFENGAGVMSRDGKRVITTNLATTADREKNVSRLKDTFTRLKKFNPRIKPASDQFCRLFDFAIDYCEEPPVLEPSEVDELMGILAREKGITSKLSSIHINFWVGEYSKVTACSYLLDQQRSSTKILSDQVVFVGDSPNDEPLFDLFSNAVGVANVLPFLGKMKRHPRFITDESGGKGFEHVASILLQSQFARH